MESVSSTYDMNGNVVYNDFFVDFLESDIIQRIFIFELDFNDLRVWLYRLPVDIYWTLFLSLPDKMHNCAYR